MEFKEILRRRRSVRKYLSRPVEREVLDTVLREALAAPSSRNSHSTHLRVVTDPETIARIARMRDYGSAFLEHAPAVVLVEGDRTATDLWRENAAITATALLFAATDAGLASCWVHVNGRPCLKDQPDGAQAEDYLREFLPVPAEHGILCAVALGYSDPAGFDFLGLNLSFSRRKSGSSNKKTATEGLRFFCFGTPCHFLLKRFIVRSGPIAANERIASPKYLSRSGIALRSSSFQCPST